MHLLPHVARCLPLLALVWVAGCRSEPPTEADYLDMVRQAVRFAAQDARAAAPRGSGTGPLLIDVNSFRGGSHRATGAVIEPGTLEAALEQPFQAVAHDSSYTCMELPVGSSCWVPQNGVYLHLNLASRAPGRVTMNVTSTVTASNYIPPVLCDRVLRLQFARQEQGWVLDQSEPLRTC